MIIIITIITIIIIIIITIIFITIIIIIIYSFIYLFILFLIQSKCLYVLELTVGFESNLNNNAVRKMEKISELDQRKWVEITDVWDL